MNASPTDVFHAHNAATGQPISPGFAEATAAEIDAAAVLAGQAFASLAGGDVANRAELLALVATKMMAHEQAIVDRCVLETGYLRQRVVGEFRRATMQLHLFAELTRRRWWDDRQVDPADPDRVIAPGVVMPRPDMRRRLVPVGPVAVFGACNFPMAISVVGNDFVSAIAVGCPVIVKSHPSHPGTCELLGNLVTEAVGELGLPPGTFSLLHGRRPETSLRLVEHPAIAAVGFTGSPHGGRALAAAVLARAQPIPIFAELGSTNPVFIAPAALDSRCSEIAGGLAESLRFGNGQMCTKPGVVVILQRQREPFIQRVVEIMSEQSPLPLLSGSVAESFDHGVAELRSATNVETLYAGDHFAHKTDSDQQLGPWHRGPHWFATDAATAIASQRTDDSTKDNQSVNRRNLLHAETFGPISLLVCCRDTDEMRQVAKQFHGSLTTTLHADHDDEAFTRQWLPIAERFAGRIVYNGWPTGMEIGPATQHGGPYPASLDGNSTSVGYASLRRFVRGVCYQNWPVDAIGGGDSLIGGGDWSGSTGPLA